MIWIKHIHSRSDESTELRRIGEDILLAPAASKDVDNIRYSKADFSLLMVKRSSIHYRAWLLHPKTDDTDDDDAGCQFAWYSHFTSQIRFKVLSKRFEFLDSMRREYRIAACMMNRDHGQVSLGQQ